MTTAQRTYNYRDEDCFPPKFSVRDGPLVPFSVPPKSPARHLLDESHCATAIRQQWQWQYTEFLYTNRAIERVSERHSKRTRDTTLFIKQPTCPNKFRTTRRSFTSKVMSFHKSRRESSCGGIQCRTASRASTSHDENIQWMLGRGRLQSRQLIVTSGKWFARIFANQLTSRF